MSTEQTIEEAIDDMPSKQRFVNKIGQAPFDEFLAAINRIIAAERLDELNRYMDVRRQSNTENEALSYMQERAAELEHLSKEGE